MSTYAKIQSGSVINVQLASPSDVFDTAFTWVDITNIVPLPQIGWSYDGVSVFTAPGVPNAADGTPVTFSTNGTIDTYAAAGLPPINVSTGTSQAVVYLSIAKALKLSDFQSAVQSFISSHYDDPTRLTFLALERNAQNLGLTNRLTYLAQIDTWAAAIIAYAATYAASVSAMSSAATVAASTWSFSGLIADPAITPMGAISIPN
jgi:hypothetical protein